MKIYSDHIKIMSTSYVRSTKTCLRFCVTSVLTYLSSAKASNANLREKFLNFRKHIISANFLFFLNLDSMPKSSNSFIKMRTISIQSARTLLLSHFFDNPDIIKCWFVIPRHFGRIIHHVLPTIFIRENDFCKSSFLFLFEVCREASYSWAFLLPPYALSWV